MRLIDADALEKTGIPFATHGGATFIALGSVRTAPTIEAAPVTKRDQLLECRSALSDGMERTAVQRDIWQNELIWWLCKAVLLLLDKEIKK